MPGRIFLKQLLWFCLAAQIAACQAQNPAAPAGTAPAADALLPVCATQRQVVEEFYAANDAGDFETSLTYLTNDVVFVGWDEGMNGRHLDQKSSVGKEYIEPFLGQDGLRLRSAREGLDQALRFEIQAWRQTGNQVFFRLMPDRDRPNGRQYNPYAVEIIFRGCQIELIKVTERITWV